MTFLRRKMDGFGVQFYGADAVSRGSVFEDQLRTIGISRRGHRNNQLTLVCEVPWRGGDVDAAQLALLKWAAAGIVTGALARLDQ
ncbi:MAG: hypothetical protein O3A10_02335 [Chloroflexi bacterium]|nr:hypothetical protein [Chloroflexota bacterium]MDA1145256.1 hypothetical protein [Chloroflexota bacterium]